MPTKALTSSISRKDQAQRRQCGSLTLPWDGLWLSKVVFMPPQNFAEPHFMPAWKAPATARHLGSLGRSPQAWKASTAYSPTTRPGGRLPRLRVSDRIPTLVTIVTELALQTSSKRPFRGDARPSSPSPRTTSKRGTPRHALFHLSSLPAIAALPHGHQRALSGRPIPGSNPARAPVTRHRRPGPHGLRQTPGRGREAPIDTT